MIYHNYSMCMVDNNQTVHILRVQLGTLTKRLIHILIKKTLVFYHGGYCIISFYLLLM